VGLYQPAYWPNALLVNTSRPIQMAIHGPGCAALLALIELDFVFSIGLQASRIGAPPFESAPTRLSKLSPIQAQVRHPAHVKNHAVAHTYQTKEHMVTNGAASHETRRLHIQMRLGKGFGCAAVRTLTFRGGNIHGEYAA
jgi:hypothetical protein